MRGLKREPSVYIHMGSSVFIRMKKGMKNHIFFIPFFHTPGFCIFSYPFHGCARSTFFSYLFVYIFHTYLQSYLAPVRARCRHPCIFEVKQGAENERKRVKFHT